VSGAVRSRGLAPRRAVNLATLLSQTSQRMPNLDALIHGACRWTWAELDSRVTALSHGLSQHGVRPGDCVLLDGPNHPEFIQSLFAIWRTGAVVAPVNSRLHTSEIAEIARICQPAAVIAHAATRDHVGAVRSSRGHIPAFYMGDAPTDSPDAAVSDATAAQLGRSSAAAGNAPVFLGDPAWYFFTSGTSGAPKAAVLTHDHLGYIVTNHIADLMPTTDHTHRSLAVAPLSHGAGVHLLPQVARGAATVIPTSASLDPAEVWALVEREQVTNMFTVPTILTRLVDHPSARSHRNASLEYVIYAGAPMAKGDQERARSVIGDVLVQYYGLAEVTGNITVLPRDEHDRPPPADLEFGSCGYPRVGMDVSIQDDEGNELPPFENGEICVCGPGVFVGYLNNPQADAAAFRDGWFRTGDIGLLDSEGYLYITGRASDMYISGGSNIHPRPIEEKLLTHPAIREAVVLGMPDPTWGEVGVAVCVAQEGQAVDERALREWLATRMARYQIPRQVVFWESLPKTGYGKVARREVRAELQARGWEPSQPSATSVPEQGPLLGH